MRPVRRQVYEDEAVIIEEAARCTELWCAVIDRARRDAAGRGVRTETVATRRKWQLEAREFLSAIKAL